MFVSTRLALTLLAGGLLMMNSCSPKKETEQKAGIDKSAYGTLSDGQAVDLYTLHNAAGMTAKITNYGGTIVSLTAPDKDGKFEEVTLGMDSLAGYEKGVPFFGALIGRYGNRIAGGSSLLFCLGSIAVDQQTCTRTSRTIRAAQRPSPSAAVTAARTPSLLKHDDSGRAQNLPERSP